jgi:hypothetical protein
MLKIKVDEGSFGDDDGVIHRVYVVDGIRYIREFNQEPILIGFGATAKEAIDDFIRRNKSDVLDIIFKGEQ